MFRHTTGARPHWKETVTAQGLTFPDTPRPDGTRAPYWVDDAYYELSSEEVDYLEHATSQLHTMCVEAARYLTSGELGDLGLPDGSLELAAASLASEPFTLYGRFDVAYGGGGDAKLLEYNADTPTGLIEAAVCQWFWLEDKFPGNDQYNSLHERLVRAWGRLNTPGARLHVAHLGSAPDEEWVTAAYLRDTADQAGLDTQALTMETIGWDADRACFVDSYGGRIDTIFKLYPWEDMLAEPFGRHIAGDTTTWVEPVWKVLLSNKMLLVALWRCFPGHPMLLPAATAPDVELGPWWVSKPLHGREGANVTVRSPEGGDTNPGPYGPEGFVYQQYTRLPTFSGNRAVCGLWVVDGKPAGLGIRESDTLITDDYARFVPHIIAAPRPDQATMAAWLDE